MYVYITVSQLRYKTTCRAGENNSSPARKPTVCKVPSTSGAD